MSQHSRSRLTLMAFVAIVALAAVTACSVRVVPVAPSRVKSAQYAEQPLLRGPTAPGAFTHTWEVGTGKGYLFDPTAIEIWNGVARLATIKGKPSSIGREAVIVSSDGFEFAALDSFREVLGPGNQGSVRYQLSRDGAQWFYHDTHAWKTAGPTSSSANTAAEVNARISDFHQVVGPGKIVIKAFLVAAQPTDKVELKQVVVQGVAYRADGSD